MLGQITSLAIVDAINPCTLAIQAILLSGLVLTKKRKEVLFAGLLFTFTIFIMYTLYGIGLLKFIYAFGLASKIKMLLKLLLIAMALIEFNAFFSYKPGMASMEMPMKFRPFAKKALQSVNSVWMVIPIAALCSIFLLPCSSGPYMAALIILSAHSLLTQAVLLIYYNMILTAPMFAITFAVFFGMSPQKVLKFKEKHIKELHLVAGILLALVIFLI